MHRHENAALESSSVDIMSAALRWRPLIAVLAVYAVASRVAGLDVFPIVEADEGLWSTGAKNVLLYGDPAIDGRTHYLLSPVFHQLAVWAMAILGPEMASARMVSATASLLLPVASWFLVLNVSRDRALATLTAAVTVCSQWATLVGRTAMIESLQVAFIAVAIAGATARSRTGAFFAIVGTALALLTKVNSAFALPVIAIAPWVALRRESPGTSTKSLIVRGSAVVTAGVAVALAAIGLLYVQHSTEFIAAYRFETVGNTFAGVSDPLIRMGRFGIDPILIGRSTLELLREAPVMLTLSLLGVAVTVETGHPAGRVAVVWVLTCCVFVWLQVFQPIRYFFLAFPAFAVLAAIALRALSSITTAPATPRLRGAAGAIAAVAALVFELSYTGMNAVANSDNRLVELRSWVLENTAPESRVIAASLYAVDIPRRAYGHYRVAQTPDEFDTAVRELGLQYAVVDPEEWPPALRAHVEQAYPLVKRFGFANIYALDP